VCRRAPLTQAAASQALYRHQVVRQLDKAAWRLLASELLKAVVEAPPCSDAKSHVVALWLATLVWVPPPPPFLDAPGWNNSLWIVVHF